MFFKSVSSFYIFLILTNQTMVKMKKNYFTNFLKTYLFKVLSITAVGIIMLFSVNTRAQCTVTNPTGSQDLTGNVLGQSFTATCTGTLSTITVELGGSTSIPNTIVSVRNGNNAAGAILGTLTGVTLNPGTTNVFDFSAQNISLTNTSQYTFIIDDNGSPSTYTLIGDGANTYSGGSLWFEGSELPYDIGFSTQITTPDSTPPVVQSIVLQGTPAANASSITKTITFDENANNITTDDFELTTTGTATGTIASVSASSGTSVVVTINSITGQGTLRLDHLGTSNITDDSGNGNGTNGNVAAFNSGSVHTVDAVAPQIQSIVRQNPTTSPTNADVLIWDVTFDEAVSNLDTTDFSITGTTATIASATNPSGNTYRITASGGDLANVNATVTLGFNAGQNITDSAGNALTNTTPTGTNNNTFVVDNTAPTLAIGAPSASTTDSGPITYTITYTGADAVTLANGDVSLNTTGDATGTIAVTGSGTATRTVTISSITGDGTLGISIAADTASDTVGNNALAAGPSATFTVDNTAPTLAIGAPSASTTNSGPITYTITYTGADAVTLANGDVSLNTTGDATGTIAVTGSGTATRTVTISSITGDGTLGISIAADTASDTVGNNALAAGPSATFTVDNTAPTLAIGAPSASATNSGPITYTITYTGADAVTLANSDVSLNTTGDATGTIAVTGSGTATRTVTISSITGDGTLGISIAADTASDTAGNNALAAGPSATFTVDNTAPTLAIGAPSASTTNSGPITYTITYTNADAVTLANGDVSLNTTGDATGTIVVTGSGTATRTVTISSITGDGTLGISIAADTASDTASNNALAAGPSATFIVDSTLSVQDDILAEGLNIYPIPANDIITIASETNLGLQNVRLFNLQGKLILSKKLDANNNTNTIDISSIHSGLYLMHIFSENGFITKRVIKQ